MGALELYSRRNGAIISTSWTKHLKPKSFFCFFLWKYTRGWDALSLICFIMLFNLKRSLTPVLLKLYIVIRFMKGIRKKTLQSAELTRQRQRQKFYMDLLKLLLRFVNIVLCISCQLPKKNKLKFDQVSKLVEASALNYRSLISQSNQCLSFGVPFAML